MQVINEYRLNKRGSKVPAVIDLGNKWPTGKANPLTRYLYLVVWLKWYTNHGEPRVMQHFLFSALDLLVLFWALRECWINALKFAGVFFVVWFFVVVVVVVGFLKSDLHVLPGVVQPLWGVGEIVPFLFLWGWGQGEGIEVLQSWNSWWVHS